MNRGLAAIATTAALVLAGCSSADDDDSGGDTVTLDFSQWWEVELSEGVMRGLMDRFEEEHEGVEVNLISNPYSATVDLQTTAAATGTLADIVAINGASVYDLQEQGAITDLSALMDDAGFDPEQLVSNDQIDGVTYMVRALNFAYPMYYNTDLLDAAGVQELPTTWSEFDDAADAVTDSDSNVYA
ncbi:MAG: extracellular solute-binding protein, partial [Ornithinimicrobium sp.]